MADKFIYVGSIEKAISTVVELLEELIEFIGRWHPLLVHMPIGMLIIAFIMAVLAMKQKYHNIAPAIPVVLLFGTIAAFLASMTGYLLSLRGGYDRTSLVFHQWLGILVAMTSLFVYLLYKGNKMKSFRLPLFVLLVLLIGFAGHFGGTLTHGKGYITDALPTMVKELIGQESFEVEIISLENVQEAFVYADVIAPILKQRCQSCHGERKKEGSLALHTKEALLKGGEGGIVMQAGMMEESELYARMILPVGHEDRMPPKGRTPITQEQIQLIGWWISEGASFDKKVNQINQSPEINDLLASLEKSENEDESAYSNLLPETEIRKDVVEKLEAKGIKVLPIADNSNYVVISAINYPEFEDQDMEELLEIKDNIVQLKLGNTSITDKAMENIEEFLNLMKLHIERTNVTDEGLVNLKKLQNLTYVNLMGLNVTDDGLKSLEESPSLRQVYAYQTKMTSMTDDNNQIRLETGQYELPFLPSDTIIY